MAYWDRNRECSRNGSNVRRSITIEGRRYDNSQRFRAIAPDSLARRESSVFEVGGAGPWFPAIDARPQVFGGERCIVRTRIPVWLLEQARRPGTSEQELLSYNRQLNRPLTSPTSPLPTASTPLVAPSKLAGNPLQPSPVMEVWLTFSTS